jgi:hypothetical protein
MIFGFTVMVTTTVAFAAETVEIVKRNDIPLCHVLPHQAAPRTLELTISEAEEESKVQCGQSALFNSDSVSITTNRVGCGTLTVEVNGRCYRP